MARFARSRQLVTLFKQTTTPTDAQGATIGDIWSKTDDNTMYVCNAVAPATFTQIGAGGGGGGSPGGSNTYVQYNDSGSFGGDSGLVYNKSTHVLTISGHFAGAITGNVTGTVSGNAGTVTNGVYTTDTGTVTNTMLAGSIANGKLANSAVANLSGTNTGDQTITLTGNVTGSGTGSFATTIGAGVVTNAMLAGSIAASKISGTAATGGGTCSGTCTGSNSGDQTNISGNAATVTTNANLTGDVTSSGNATTIGAGKVTEAMQALANNTTNNVSTSKHGYVPILPNDATKFLDGTGVFSTPSGGGSSPWAAGSGTGSAIGGDGTCTAAGNYSICFGSGSSVCAGSNSASIGAAGNACNGAFSIAVGYGGSLGGSYSAIFGDYNTTSGGGRQFCLGSGNTCTNSFNWAFGSNITVNNQGCMTLGDDSPGGLNPVQDTDSSQFNATFNGGFKFFTTGGVSNVQALGLDINANVINKKGTADQSYSLQAPSTGFSITIAAGVKTLILNPAGTLATGTVTMPAAPIDGQEIRVCSSQTITGLTVAANSGQSIEGNPTALGVGGGFAYIYNLSGTKWFRLY